MIRVDKSSFSSLEISQPEDWLMCGNQVEWCALTAFLALMTSASGLSQDPGGPKRDTIISSIGIRLTLIPAGDFLMGSSDDPNVGGFSYILKEQPQHKVRITRSFYLGVHEVTQGQYRAVLGYNPSYFAVGGGGQDIVAAQPTDQLPVENVSWLDAVVFCNRLSERDGL
jgi:formylglycine-generating enzyme required for sulfatase activity